MQLYLWCMVWLHGMKTIQKDNDRKMQIITGNKPEVVFSKLMTNVKQFLRAEICVFL